MTAAKQARAKGLDSLQQVANMTGQSRETLSNWHKFKTDLFRIVLTGCKKETHEAKSDELRIKTYTDYKGFLSMTITHEPTGISIKGRDITYSALKRDLTKEINKLIEGNSGPRTDRRRT